jgi:hypothetical protein
MQIPELSYMADSGWQPIPEWGQFYVGLGREMAEPAPEDGRLFVGMFVPVRSYAAALVAVGIVAGRTSHFTRGDDSEQHFANLCELDDDALLLYCVGSTILKARFSGVGTDGGTAFIRIRVTRKQRKCGDWTSYVRVSKQECHRLGVDASSATRRDLSAQPSVVVAERENAFLKTFLSDIELMNFLAISRLDCLIVGCKNVLKDELRLTRLSARSNDRRSGEGTLQDIVCAKSLTSSWRFRTDILSERARKPPDLSMAKMPHTVIYDGSAAFIRWHAYFGQSNCLVILSPVDPSVRDATDLMRTEFLARRGFAELAVAQKRPPSAELVSFCAVRKG